MFQNLTDEVDLLHRHLVVYNQVLAHEPIGIVAIAKKTGLSEYQVRYSLSVLEEYTLITPTQNGAITTQEAAELFEEYHAKVENVSERLHQLLMTELTSPIE